jgi:hypothetical protein
VFRIAEWLYTKGWSVKIPATRYAPYGSNSFDYVDDGDLYIQQNGDWKRIDVKHINTNFTNAKDWPYDKVIISGKLPIERADPFPTAYIIVNKQMTHVGIIWDKTKAHWYEEKIFASNYGRDEDFYVCQVEHVDFRELSYD